MATDGQQVEGSEGLDAGNTKGSTWKGRGNTKGSTDYVRAKYGVYTEYVRSMGGLRIENCPSAALREREELWIENGARGWLVWLRWSELSPADSIDTFSEFCRKKLGSTGDRQKEGIRLWF